MIVANGFFQIELDKGSDTDELGRPTESNARWQGNSPCRIQVNNDNRLGEYSEGGIFHKATHTLLIDGLQEFQYKRVRLYRTSGAATPQHLGDFRVISAEPLDAVQATKVAVTK